MKNTRWESATTPAVPAGNLELSWLIGEKERGIGKGNPLR